MGSLSPKVCIVLLNYNGTDDAIECLASLNDISYDNYNIVIVDNASTDDSMDRLDEYLRTLDDEYKVFSSPEQAMECNESQARWTLLQTCHNGGFGYGNNIGIKYALTNNADYILTINNDTVVDPNFLEPMVELCEKDKYIGIVSGKIYYYDRPDVIWFNGGSFNRYTAKVGHANFNEKDIGQCPPETITFISGCVWLVPRAIFVHIGLINEEYFMYVEDLEYSQRVLSQGYTLKVCQKSHIWHKVGGSTGGYLSEFSIYWMARNKTKFVRRFIPIHRQLIGVLYLGIIDSLKWLLKMKIKLVRCHFKGVIDGLNSK